MGGRTGETEGFRLRFDFGGFVRLTSSRRPYQGRPTIRLVIGGVALHS